MKSPTKDSGREGGSQAVRTPQKERRQPRGGGGKIAFDRAIWEKGEKEKNSGRAEEGECKLESSTSLSREGE